MLNKYIVYLKATVYSEIIIEATSMEEAERMASIDSSDSEEIERETSVLYGETERKPNVKTT